MFDLDGTLADSLTDIGIALNHVLTDMNLRGLDTDRIRQITGRGLKWLMEQALGDDHQDLVSMCMERMLEYYRTSEFDHTKPYPGIPQLLDALTDEQVTLAVLSNKPDQTTVKVIRQVFGRWQFSQIRGQREGVRPKPDPSAAIEIADTLNIPEDQWLFVGDSAIDMLTADAAGMTPVGVSWGFRDVAELEAHNASWVIDQPLELLEILESSHTT